MVVRSDGHLLTNAHLVDGADRVEVRLHGQEMRRADVVGSDDATDLAVLRVDVDGLEPAALGSAEHLRAGDDVIALGHAHGMLGDASVEQRVVSELDQRLKMPSNTVLHGMILLDAPLTDGAAGGPLLDGAGAVIGITNAIPAAANERAYGVATPADVAVHAAEHLMEHGRVQHVWLGIEGIDLQPDRAAELGVAGGASIKDVADDSPAAAAGLAPGDVVVGVDDTSVSSMSEVIATLRTHDPGDTVGLTVRRGEDEVRTSAVLAQKTR
ncbi:MAG: trypsin-like peptidase domain-containing protein [Acidimicrobiales bacterium]|nr:trypsin-like peptidase domain-containing protein [Acidimicrobiales bacterium]